MEKKERKIARVVIFGRTNVGKSTLFNALVEKNQALVSKISGTTRDSNLNLVRWQGYEFELVDTAGAIDTYFLETKKIKGDDIESQVQRQIKRYLKDSDLILFVVDGQHGLLPDDLKINKIIKKKTDYKKKTILTVNKIDNPKHRPLAAEFNKLAWPDICLISSATGSGTGDLLEIIIKKLKGRIKKVKEEKKEEVNIKVCIIGQPNVGKSSLLNALAGENKVIVSSIPHTTREPKDTHLEYKDKKIIIFDTAGISRQGTKTEGLEKEGILKSEQTLKKSDIVLLMIDINQPIAHQDARLIEKIFEQRKSLIIIANKWDLIEERDTKKFTNYVYSRFPFATFIPIIFMSAKHGGKIDKLLDLVLEIQVGREMEISDSILNKFLSRIVKLHLPAKAKGVKNPHIYNFSQTAVNPPRFEVKIGSKDTLHFSYIRFIENRLREKFGFLGTPLHMVISTNRHVHGMAEGKEKK